jgi:hypothetical protein
LPAKWYAMNAFIVFLVVETGRRYLSYAQNRRQRYVSHDGFENSDIHLRQDALPIVSGVMFLPGTSWAVGGRFDHTYIKHRKMGLARIIAPEGILNRELKSKALAEVTKKSA